MSAGPDVGADGNLLAKRYSGLVCDLDGVVYRGPSAIPDAVETLNAIELPVVYATNNASRTPTEVATHLNGLGLHTNADHVVTSAAAGAAELARRFAAGERVLAVGGPGVAIALQAVGLSAVRPDSGDGEVVAVLQGYGPGVSAADLAEAAYAIEGGALWVATNDDMTLPTDRGIAPGNGSLVAAVATATGTRPTVMGKPQPPLYTMSADLLGTSPAQTLGIGDRLDTDIAGANAAGMDCVLVLTGVSGPVDAALAAPALRPRFVIADLRGLLEPYADPVAVDGGWRSGGAHATIADGGLVIVGTPPRPEPGPWIDGIRAGLAAIWALADGADPDHDRLALLASQLPPAG